jgi:hypothetical protein
VYGPGINESNGKEKWVSQEIKDDDRSYILKYRIDTKTKNQIIQRLLNWYIEMNRFTGESVTQDDDCRIYSIEVLSDIAELFQFEQGESVEDWYGK